MHATITSKGQITIPVKIREKLDLRPGDVVNFDEEASYLKGYKVFDSRAMYAVIGCRKDAMPELSGEQLLEDLRGSVESPAENANGD